MFLSEGDRVPAASLFQRGAMLGGTVRHSEGRRSCGLLEQQEGCASGGEGREGAKRGRDGNKSVSVVNTMMACCGSSASARGGM